MKVDLLLVVDHLGADCGVKFTYLKFIQWCHKAGISLALISDSPEKLDSPAIKKQLNLAVPDVRDQYIHKRRPMFSLIEEGALVHKDLPQQGVSEAQAHWLDAWNGDRSWLSEVREKSIDFAGGIEPDKVLITTQSFLGFSQEPIYRSQEPAICLHTHYAAFYAIRIAGVQNQVFRAMENAGRARLHKHFIEGKNRLFLNSHSSAPFFEQAENLNYQIFTPGVDTHLFKPNQQPVSGHLRILCIGRLSKEKGVDNLSALMRATPFAQWVLAGQAKDNMAVDFPKNAEYLGFLDHPALAREMSQSNVLVFYGQWDTFGMVALEALSCGIPVLASAGSEIARIVEHENCGWSFDSKEALTDRLRQLNQDGVPLPMRMNARTFAEGMTWENTFTDFTGKLGL